VETILIVCAAGAASTFLASRMRAIARDRNTPVSVEAISQPELASRLGSASVLLIGPHLEPASASLSRQATRYGVATAVLPDTAYRPGGAEECFDLATGLLKRKPTSTPHQNEGIPHG
jgi:PTS system cellobiose-specific IIB component